MGFRIGDAVVEVCSSIVDMDNLNEKIFIGDWIF
jgi:hypothetical protein